VAAQRAIQEIHDAFVLHVGRQEIRLPLPDPYVTFDYQAFCQAMLAQTNAEVWQARATDFVAGGVATTRGTVQARFIVDATGWRALHHSRGAESAPGPLHVGYGLETELPIRLDLSPGLHFYVEKHIVHSGYGWVFPCGDTTRFGIGAFEKGPSLGRLLAQFLERFGLQPDATHGGVLAIAPRDPVADDVFVVGDAAGQCLPASGEGIRTAIFHGIHCGRAITAALRGAISADESRALYREQARGADSFHGRLLKLQALVAAMPDPLLAAVGRICSQPALTHHIMRKYLIDSGWFLG
jgi:flavin-dependent dehydrogenase